MWVMNMRQRVAAIMIVVFGPLFLVGAQPKAASWYPVQRIQEVFAISDPNKGLIKTFIRSIQGTPLYLFVCRTGEDTAVPNIVYTNDLDCRLIPARLGEIEENLLVEEPKEKAWFSRAHMIAQQLFGECADYPEYGKLRHFMLRGMRLTIEFFDVEFAATPPPVDGPPSARLRSYKLRLTVVPDRTARRAIAERSGYLDPLRRGQLPTRSCAVVQKGRER